MTAISDYLENKLIDHLFKATAFTPPGTIAAALFAINKGSRANSTAYSVGDVIHVVPTGASGGDTNPKLYRCTTAGTTAASQGSLYGGVPAEAITDGTAVFTEISPVFDTGTGFPSGLAEVTGGSYARVSNNPSSTTNWTNTQGGSSGASSGTGGTTSNVGALTYPAPTANWGIIGAVGLYDATSAGNLLLWGVLTTPKTVNNGDAAPSFAIGALVFSLR